MGYPRGSKVAKQLGEVVIGQGVGCLDFQDEAAVHDEVGQIFANDRAIVVEDEESSLSFHLQAQSGEPMRHGVFVNLLEVAGSVIGIDGITRFTDEIRKLEDWVLHAPKVEEAVASREFVSLFEGQWPQKPQGGARRGGRKEWLVAGWQARTFCVLCDFCG